LQIGSNFGEVSCELLLSLANDEKMCDSYIRVPFIKTQFGGGICTRNGSGGVPNRLLNFIHLAITICSSKKGT
jgi:hypothetical protein